MCHHRFGRTQYFLGWYADKDQITKEISEIQNAIVNGVATYTLKYSAKQKENGQK